jgi:hypothetical protein
VLVRLAHLLGPPAFSALAFLAVCLTLGLPVAVAAGIAAFAAAGALLAVAICAGSAAAREPDAAPRQAPVAVAEARFARDEQGAPTRDRVA